MSFSNLQVLDIWRQTMVSSVRQSAPDLSARQMALLLTVYLTPPPHTVRGLAALLEISKPAVSRAIDRLTELGLLCRQVDDNDRRSVLIERTPEGTEFLGQFAALILGAVDDVEPEGALPAESRPAAVNH